MIAPASLRISAFKCPLRISLSISASDNSIGSQCSPTFRRLRYKRIRSAAGERHSAIPIASSCRREDPSERRAQERQTVNADRGGRQHFRNLLGGRTCHSARGLSGPIISRAEMAARKSFAGILYHKTQKLGSIANRRALLD